MTFRRGSRISVRGSNQHKKGTVSQNELFGNWNIPSPIFFANDWWWCKEPKNVKFKIIHRRLFALWRHHHSKWLPGPGKSNYHIKTIDFVQDSVYIVLTLRFLHSPAFDRSKLMDQYTVYNIHWFCLLGDVIAKNSLYKSFERISPKPKTPGVWANLGSHYLVWFVSNGRQLCIRYCAHCFMILLIENTIASLFDLRITQTYHGVSEAG